VLVLAPIGSALAHALYVTRVGGDFMHGRLLLPGLFALVLPFAVVVVPKTWNWRWPAVAGVVTWGLVCAVWLRVPYQRTVGRDSIADERGTWVAALRTPHPVRLSYPHHAAAVRQIERFAAATSARLPGVAEAARALRCEPLSRLLSAVSGPLDLRRFLRNVREAWRFHRLRIPADPVAAMALFCAT
jgi:hypothetical protein